MITDTGFWHILLCWPSQTQPISRRMEQDGWLVRVPLMAVRRRLPRKRSVETVIVPVLPGFVFVSSEQGLFGIRRKYKAKPMLVNGELAIASTQEIDLLEESSVMSDDVSFSHFAPGSEVEASLGTAISLKGIVLGFNSVSCRYKIETEAGIPFEISPFLLSAIDS